MATFQKRNQNFNRPGTFKAHYTAVQLEEPLLTITRESLCIAMKTQCSQKYIHIHIKQKISK